MSFKITWSATSHTYRDLYAINGGVCFFIDNVSFFKEDPEGECTGVGTEFVVSDMFGFLDIARRFVEGVQIEYIFHAEGSWRIFTKFGNEIEIAYAVPSSDARRIPEYRDMETRKITSGWLANGQPSIKEVIVPQKVRVPLQDYVEEVVRSSEEFLSYLISKNPNLKKELLDFYSTLEKIKKSKK